MLKSISKGQERERRASELFHQFGIPILVSPHLLRKMNCGQCDLVRFFPRESLIEIVEVKGELGESLSQRARIRKASLLLSALLDANVSIKIWREFANHFKVH